MESHKPNGEFSMLERPELFLFTAGQSAESKPARALTNDELRAYLADVMAQHQEAVQQINTALSALTNSARFMAALEFEIERRAKSIAIELILPGAIRLRD